MTDVPPVNPELTLLPFDLANWYWFVGGDETRVYSSAKNDYVPVDDATYKAWVESGGLATRTGQEGELGETLGPLPLETHIPVPQNVRVGYFAYKENDNELWLDHEDRLRAIEMRLGISESPPLASVEKRIEGLKKAHERKRKTDKK